MTPGPDGASPGADQGAFDELIEMLTDRVEDLVIEAIELTRDRPGLVLAVLAGVGGALIGMVAAGVTARRRARRPRARLGASLAKIRDALELEERGRRVASPVGRAARRGASAAEAPVSGLRDLSRLLPVGAQLLSNPFVRGYISTLVRRALRERLT